MRPKAPRVGDKYGGPRHPEWETSVRDKWETSVNSCGPRHPEWETSMGNKWKTSVNSCGPRYPECEISVKDKYGRRVWEISVNCKLMRPKAPRMADKCERQVEDTCKLMRPKAPRVGCKPGDRGKIISPGMQPFERSKNPIQVSLLGE